jgi:hypothetical protein
MKFYIWSIALYGAETLTLGNVDQKYPALRLRMSGAILLLPLYTFMLCSGTSLRIIQINRLGKSLLGLCDSGQGPAVSTTMNVRVP